LARFKSSKGWSGAGLDPSAKAISALNDAGLRGVVGTAEALPQADQSVDLLIYGFCLYLCDRDDLFQIAAEAHRVLKPKSWLAILDFRAPSE
jgi:ubiquinone/menaquinone biosynthesis C-methylase UbiE